MAYVVLLSEAAKTEMATNNPNLFVKPNEQSLACLNFVMARNGRMRFNLFIKGAKIE